MNKLFVLQLKYSRLCKGNLCLYDTKFETWSVMIRECLCLELLNVLFIYSSITGDKYINYMIYF